MNIFKILLCSSVFAQELDGQVIVDIEKYIQYKGSHGSHTANIDDIQSTLKNCKFFMFRHHRSAADRFERIIKSDENAHLLRAIIAVDKHNLTDKMNVVVDNYKEAVKECEPILLSNVLSVEKYYREFIGHYQSLPQGSSRKQLVDEALYLRMRNFQRAMNGGKRLEKAQKKGFRDDFVWQTSLSEEYRRSDEKKIKKYIKANFPNGTPQLLEPFKTIFEIYNTNRIEELKANKAQQLIDYFFNGKELGVLDWTEYPADPKQADQMKRWLLRGETTPALYKNKPEVKQLCDDLAQILRSEKYDNIPESWFADLVGVDGKVLERNSSNNVDREGLNEDEDYFADWLENEVPMELNDMSASNASIYRLVNMSMFFM